MEAQNTLNNYDSVLKTPSTEPNLRSQVNNVRLHMAKHLAIITHILLCHVIVKYA